MPNATKDKSFQKEEKIMNYMIVLYVLVLAMISSMIMGNSGWAMYFTMCSVIPVVIVVGLDVKLFDNILINKEVEV